MLIAEFGLDKVNDFVLGVAILPILDFQIDVRSMAVAGCGFCHHL
jgi:hypothetical protein